MPAWRMRILATPIAALCAVLVLLTGSMAVAQTKPPAAGPEIKIGSNVFLIPDPAARSITGWLVVLAGCADEAEGKCVGIAHYLEHLLFINRDEEHRSKVALFADGTGNGWTTHRTTTYFQRFPARPETNRANLDKLVAYFAGLLTDVKVDAAQAARERNIVLQEYQQNTGRNPFARFGIALNLAEGAGRSSLADQKHFFSIAMGSLRECQAILDLSPEPVIAAQKCADSLAAHIYCLIRSYGG